MAKARILHMLFADDKASPFDINMAVDAGFETIVPYASVDTADVSGLIQDTIFSRPPRLFNYTGVFIGGWDVEQAADMLQAAQKALVSPFEVSLFADPNGAYTTSAALVALVSKHLRARDVASYAGLNVMIFGGGPVGLCAAVLIAQQGGNSQLVRLTRPSAEKQQAVIDFGKRYGVTLSNVDGHTEGGKLAALQQADVVITTAKAGIQVLNEEHLLKAGKLLVAADVNAVPPSGIAGIDAHDDGVALAIADNEKAAGVGALAIGDIKYKVQHGLFKKMLNADHAVVLDIPEAYQLAEEITRGV